MGITAASRAQYENAIKKLFPKGDYWDKQFADPDSDTYLFIKAKAAELVKFRERMGALLYEGKPESTTELIDEWERVILNKVFINLDIDRRRSQLLLKNTQSPNLFELQKTAAIFKLHIQDVTVPCRPRLFGFAHFGQERIGSFSAFYVVRIAVAEAEVEEEHWQKIKAEFEEAIRNKLFANQMPIFYYGEK